MDEMDFIRIQKLIYFRYFYHNIVFFNI